LAWFVVILSILFLAAGAALAAGFFYAGLNLKVIRRCIERTAILTGSLSQRPFSGRGMAPDQRRIGDSDGIDYRCRALNRRDHICPSDCPADRI